MPGPVVHTIVAEQLADAVATRPECDPDGRIEGLIRTYPRQLALGAQGPDPLFFNLNDWPVIPRHLVQAYLEVSNFVAEFKARLKEMFPFLVAIDEFLSDVASSSYTVSEIANMIDMVQAVISGLITDVQAYIQRYVLDLVDVYSFFSHPIQNCDTERDDWWWFDTLHYRRTGQFATALLEESRRDDATMAYAIGYLSHVAADTVGHPYVNVLVRGPYRTHSQRHKTVENFQDVWAYDHYIGGELSTSRFHERQLLTRNGQPDLPDGISRAMAIAAERTYEGEYGTLLPDDLEGAYRFWYTWFRNATETGSLEPELPNYIPPDNPTKKAVEELLENLGDLGDTLTGSPSLKGLLNFFKELGESALSALAVGLSAIDYVAGKLLSIPRKILYGLLSMVYQSIYDAYEKFRLLVAALGFAYPLRHQLQLSVLQHLVDPRIPDATGRAAKDAGQYPLQQLGDRRGPNTLFPSHLAGLESTAHLIYPSTEPERDVAYVGPEEYLKNTPDYYIDGPIDLQSRDVRDLSEIGPDRFKKEFAEDRIIGNAVDLTVELLCNYLVEEIPIPDLNLDGDRGFTFPPWAPSSCPRTGILSSPVVPRVVD
jgi:hypothetical protein